MMDIKRHVRFLVVKKAHLVIGLKDTRRPKILLEKNREPIYYKITKPQSENCIRFIETKRVTYTMNELAIDIKNKYPTFDITSQHLGHVIRDNNQTRKRTSHEHFPKTRYKKPIEKQT